MRLPRKTRCAYIHLSEKQDEIADDRDGGDTDDVPKDEEEGLLGRHAEARAVDGRLIGVRIRHHRKRIREGQVYACIRKRGLLDRDTRET